MAITPVCFCIYINVANDNNIYKINNNNNLNNKFTFSVMPNNERSLVANGQNPVYFCELCSSKKTTPRLLAVHLELHQIEKIKMIELMDYV